MQFEQHTINIRTGFDPHDRQDIPAMVEVGSGLAYHRLSGEDAQPYTITHLKSGVNLGPVVETEQEAQRWLELITPLTDWTQDETTLKRLGREVQQQVLFARNQAENEREAQLKTLIPAQDLNDLEIIACAHLWSFHETLAAAVEALIEREDQEQSEQREEDTSSPIPSDTLLQTYKTEVIRTYAGANTARDMLTLSALGLTGEAGEVADALKKHLFQGHELDESHMIEELGDILWYLTLACQALNTTLETVMDNNITKLRHRYPNGFEAERSIHREMERKSL